jgi:AraC family transcriptional regulator, regulatory protein of adaptative response / methylated-DNA-[protein]-cysteine methyltransferase
MVDDTSRLWAAVQARDRTADGLFVYAVRTTGIFCRPSCPSRRPRQDRVTFFPSSPVAAAHGYRPCRRCRPDSRSAIAHPLAHIQRACTAIARAPERAWSSKRIAAAAGSSVAQVQRAFRSQLGLSPRDYVAACRNRAFLARLRAGESVTSAVYDTGYGSPSRVYGGPVKFGMTPATYGKGGAGARIDWLIGRSPIGFILVAATLRGVCFVEVGESSAVLMRALKAELPRATIAARPSTRLRAWMAAAQAVAAARPAPADVPADIRGTAFQWRVWTALRAIPAGKTLTYTELASRAGAPASVRAVARACAVNPLALLTPCHRVVGADGTLRGYRWGVDVKQALIERERRSGR